MLGDRRSRLAALLWAASAVAIFTTACGSAAEAPQAGARVVASGPAEPVTPDMATAAALKSVEEPASPTPVVEAVPTRQPIMQVAAAASPTPNGAASETRMTAPAMFMVENTLGRGMALRSAPVTRTSVGRAWPDGTRMAGLGQEQEAYGWTWRRVRDPEGNIGWMPSNYLILDDDATVATGNGGSSSLRPPSAPPTLIIVPTFATPEPTPAPDIRPTPDGRTPADSATGISAPPASSPVALPTPRGNPAVPVPPAAPALPAQVAAPAQTGARVDQAAPTPFVILPPQPVPPRSQASRGRGQQVD